MNVTARVTSRAHEVSRTRSIFRKVRATTLGLVSVAVSALIFYPVPAAADPPLTVAEARSLVAQLQTDAGAIDQQYSGVKEQIKQGREQLRLKRADVKLQTDKVARMRLQVGQVALAQFQNRSLDTAAQLIVTPDTDGFLSQISTVQNVSENQNSVLQDYQQAQANLGALEHSAEIDLATLAEKAEAAEVARGCVGQEDRRGQEGVGQAQLVPSAIRSLPQTIGRARAPQLLPKPPEALPAAAAKGSERWHLRKLSSANPTFAMPPGPAHGTAQA